MKYCSLILCLVILSLAPARAQDPLAAARELYASASYEEALTALTRLRSSENDRGTLERIDTYRAFSLFALGRTDEAQEIVDQLVTADPVIAVSSDDASPRIVAMFTDARKRLLPEIIRTHYRTAKAAVDAKDFAAAEPELMLVKNALSAAETVGVLDPTSAALGDVVDAVIDLVHAATPAAPAPPARAATPPPAPTVEPPKAAMIYDSLSEGIVAPVTLQQRIPSMPADAVRQLRERQKSTPGVLSIVIDENGRVERASMLVPLHPMFDRMVLDATRSWVYKPAAKNGVPVKFEKTISFEPPPAQ